MTTTATGQRAPHTHVIVPFVDLQRVNAPLGDALKAAFSRVLDTASFTLGPEVERFEASFAQCAGTAHAVGVSTGTDALHLTLRALGVGPGDEVITAVNTFAATAEAIRMCGADPVFVDVEPDTLLMDARSIGPAVTPRTRGIIPVHLYGQPVDMDAVLDVASKHGLFVVEDACQAHGATYRGRPVGSLGNAACFSFYPSKNLGALGDGGIVTTDDEAIDQRVRLLRNHGENGQRLHTESAYCARLHTLQAVLLQEKLPYLTSWNRWRSAAATLYAGGLAGSGATTLATRPERLHVFHLFVIRVYDREAVRARLASHGIQTGVHYPVPLHLEPAFADLGQGPGDYPVAERACAEILSLPMYPYITPNEVEAVIAEVREALHG